VTSSKKILSLTKNQYSLRLVLREYIGSVSPGKKILLCTLCGSATRNLFCASMSSAVSFTLCSMLHALCFSLWRELDLVSKAFLQLG
jgi:hypothetical protein